MYNNVEKQKYRKVPTFTFSLHWRGKLGGKSVPVHCSALLNAYIEQLKYLAVVCAETMLQKSQKIYDETYLFPGADNCEENRENSIFVSLTL